MPTDFPPLLDILKQIPDPRHRRGQNTPTHHSSIGEVSMVAASDDVPEREFAVYVGGHYALLRGSELVALILEHHHVWGRNKEKILSALQMAEGTRLDC